MEKRTLSRTPDSDPQHCRYQIQTLNTPISILRLNKSAVTSTDQSNPPPPLFPSGSLKTTVQVKNN
jgi:hypothetical protein